MKQNWMLLKSLTFGFGLAAVLLLFFTDITLGRIVAGAVLLGGLLCGAIFLDKRQDEGKSITGLPLLLLIVYFIGCFLLWVAFP